jgi:hypothetical protein
MRNYSLTTQLVPWHAHLARGYMGIVPMEFAATIAVQTSAGS